MVLYAQHVPREISVWLEEGRGRRGGWKCAAMECGGLSVIGEAGTPGMLLWRAGSCGTSMKVSTLYLHYNLSSTVDKSSQLTFDCTLRPDQINLLFHGRLSL